MSNAAVTAGASPLDHNWAIESLPCTKLGMKGGPRVLDLSKIIDSGGSSLAQLSVRRAPRASDETLGHQEVSSFKAMTQAMGAGEATVGTAAFRKAAGPRIMAAWGLEGLRGSLHSRGSKVFLPALPEQSTSEQQTPAAQQERVVAPTYQQDIDELPDTQETAAAPVATAPETRSSQDSVIAQLRAQLAVGEAPREVTKTTPGSWTPGIVSRNGATR